MTVFKLPGSEKWYKAILWWELMRIIYNVVMIVSGWLSFYICFVTIPLIYLLIGFAFNVLYTFGWITELAFAGQSNKIKYRQYTFIGYLIFSILLVVGFAVYLILPR